MKVLFLPKVREYLKEVSYIMYEQDYFGFLDSSERYMEELISEIIKTLPIRQKKAATTYFKKYGDKLFYATFKKNKHTQWYVFFNLYEEKGELIYLIRYINNNHIIAQYL